MHSTSAATTPVLPLDGGLVGAGGEGLGGVVGDRDVASLTGLGGETLENDGLALLLGLVLLGGVRLDAVEELLAALGVLDVLNADVDTLLHVAAVHNLVAKDTDGAGSDVEDLEVSKKKPMSRLAIPVFPW